jgi:SAM-dependent methyltransferase
MSYGLDINARQVKFATSIGLQVYQRSIFDPLDDLPQTDVVWTSDTLEHVDSPHRFLRQTYRLLKDDGLLFVKVPTIPHHRLPLPILRRYQNGYRHDDHINGFTCATLRFLCERSGFQTITVGMFVAPAQHILNQLWFTESLGQTVYIGRKISNWRYPEKSTHQVGYWKGA